MAQRCDCRRTRYLPYYRSHFSCTFCIELNKELAQASIAMSTKTATPSWSGERHVVTGGCLGEGMAWMPSHVEAIGGRKYIQLQGQDSRLCRYIGLPKGVIRPNYASFLSHMRSLRNAAVAVPALKSYQDKVDSYCRQLDTKQLLKVSLEDLPENVRVEYEGHEIVFRTDLHPKHNVALLSDASNLDAFGAASPAFHDEGAGQRPPPQPHHPLHLKTRFRCIKAVGGKRPYVKVQFFNKTEVSRKRFRVQKFPSTCQLECATAAKDAINFLRTNHHAAADDGMQLAAPAGLDVFSESGELHAWAAQDCDDDETGDLLKTGGDDEDDSDDEDDASQDA